MKKILVGAIVGAMALLSSSSFGQQDYEAQVRRQIIKIRAAGVSGGWRETHSNKIETLNQGGSTSFGVTLEKGWGYKLIGICDNDCSDIDMILYDENDNQISRDVGSDSMPMVEVSPKWTGRFFLKVVMARCSNDPCVFGVVILGK